MIYLIVMIVSALGILAIISMRGFLRSRNARRIVRSVRKGITEAENRNVKFLPDTPAEMSFKSPRARAIELQQARSALKQADKALAKRDHKTAERALIQALTMQSEEKEIRVKLAQVYAETHRLPKAEALYRELLAEHKDSILFACLGRTLYRAQKFDESCNAYSEALSLDPDNPDRAADLGRACVAAGYYEDATKHLGIALKRKKRDLELLHMLARCYVQLGKNEEAHETYKAINRMDPRDKDVLIKLRELAAA